VSGTRSISGCIGNLGSLDKDEWHQYLESHRSAVKKPGYETERATETRSQDHSLANSFRLHEASAKVKKADKALPGWCQALGNLKDKGRAQGYSDFFLLSSACCRCGTRLSYDRLVASLTSTCKYGHGGCKIKSTIT